MSSTGSQWHRQRRLAPIAVMTAAAASLLGVGIALSSDRDSDLKDAGEEKPAIARRSISSLMRSYIVWTVLGIPRLVDLAPELLDRLLQSSIPGIPLITEGLVRETFFAQFIPGETAVQCVPAMETLRRRNVGSALNYCAEADLDESANAEIARMREVETALDVQGALETRLQREGWERGSSAFALKVVRLSLRLMTPANMQTGLIDPDALSRAAITLHRLRRVHHRDYEAAVPFPGCPSDGDAELLCPTTGETASFDKYDQNVPTMSITQSQRGIKEGDLEKLRTLWHRLDSLAQRAARNG